MVHVGFGHGLWGFTDALRSVGWDPPRYTTTAFEMAHINAEWMRHLSGWIGLDSYDERNEIGQAFLDRFEARYGRRPGNSMPLLCHDAATVITRGLAAARPLTGEGVKQGMEQVKLIPSASGAPGTSLRFGRFIRQGWMGTDYLIARRVLPDGSEHVFHAVPSDHISRAVGVLPRRLDWMAPNTGAVTMPGGCANTSGTARTAPIAIIRWPGWACWPVASFAVPADVELKLEARHALDDGADEWRLFAGGQRLEAPLREGRG